MNSYSVKVAVLEYSKCYTIIESAVTVVNLRHMKMYILQIFIADLTHAQLNKLVFVFNLYTIKYACIKTCRGV